MACWRTKRSCKIHPIVNLSNDIFLLHEKGRITYLTLQAKPTHIHLLRISVGSWSSLQMCDKGPLGGQGYLPYANATDSKPTVSSLFSRMTPISIEHGLSCWLWERWPPYVPVLGLSFLWNLIRRAEGKSSLATKHGSLSPCQDRPSSSVSFFDALLHLQKDWRRWMYLLLLGREGYEPHDGISAPSIGWQLFNPSWNSRAVHFCYLVSTSLIEFQTFWK